MSETRVPICSFRIAKRSEPLAGNPRIMKRVEVLKSTTFLASIVADRLGIDLDEVFDGLVEVAQRDPENIIS